MNDTHIGVQTGARQRAGRESRRRRAGRGVRAAALAMIVLGGSVGLDAAVSSASPARPAGKHLVTVTFGQPGNSSAWGYLDVARRAGYFARNGINAVFDTVSVPAIIPGMVSGSFQATPLTGTAERAALEGQSVVDVMTVENRDDAALGVDSGITSISQLAGKTIVTATPGTAPYATLAGLLAKNGLTGKVKILPLATVADQETAFISGEAQATLITYGNVIQAEAKIPGSRILVTPPQAGPVGGFSGIAVSQSYLAGHSKVVSGIIKSVLEAVKLVKTNRPLTEKYFEGAFGFTKKQAALLYADADTIYQLNPVPTNGELSNDAATDSAATGHAISEAQVSAIWRTSLAAQAYKALKCPKIC